MDVRSVGKLNAYFNAEGQKTGIAIRRVEDDLFDVRAAYRQTQEEGFPRLEVLKRGGSVGEDAVNMLVVSLLEVCDGWFHHYSPSRSGQTSVRTSAESWWGLRIEYSDGAVRRWEGMGAAPWNINDVYFTLKDFGMPALNMDWPNSFAQQFANHTPRKGLELVEYYERLLGEVRGLETEDEPSDDTMLVAREFVDDVGRWLIEEQSGISQRTNFKLWDVEPNLESLQEVDVHEAPRLQIYALYEALTCTDDPVTTILCLQENGVLASWRQRLDELPKQGYWGIRNNEREAYEAEGAAVDKEVRKFIEAGTVFTARDVAERIGCTGQRTSARIRAFVNRGELKVVQDTAPRRYQVA